MSTDTMAALIFMAVAILSIPIIFASAMVVCAINAHRESLTRALNELLISHERLRYEIENVASTENTIAEPLRSPDL